MSSKDDWLTTEQVAELLQLSVETVRRWIREGDLPVLDLPGRRGGYRVSRTDLDKYIESRYGPVGKDVA